MSRAANPFRPGTVALVLLVGAGAFLLLLYALGQGWTGQRDRNGGDHAASTGLTGFAGLVAVLEGTGHDVALSRSPAAFDTPHLLVLTPPLFANGDELADLIAQRRYTGPTLLVLPKWYATPIPDEVEVERQPGWVMLGGAGSPGWFAELGLTAEGRLAVGQTSGWQGFDERGALPDPAVVQALVGGTAPRFEPLVTDTEGDTLAGAVWHDGDAWPVVTVFEPDLMNNYGLADRARAGVAYELVHIAMDGDDLPVVFDLTLAGLGASENLLTLAFSPPFLAATLCLLLAALVIAWRGFARFGPPRVPAPAMAQGKRQLALNGAALLARLRRWHLLREPYATLVARRIAGTLGLRVPAAEAREQAIDQALERTDHQGPDFTTSARALREADSPRTILRSARALRDIERILNR